MPVKKLSAAEAAEVVSLRKQDPQRWSVATLTKRFGTTPAEITAALGGTFLRAQDVYSGRAKAEAPKCPGCGAVLMFSESQSEIDCPACKTHVVREQEPEPEPVPVAASIQEVSSRYYAGERARVEKAAAAKRGSDASPAPKSIRALVAEYWKEN